MFRAEDNMHKVEAQRLRHGRDYMRGLQPSPVSANAYLGLRPRLVCRRTFGPHSISLHPRQYAIQIQRHVSLNARTLERNESPKTRTRQSHKRQRRDNIPAWAEGPGKPEIKRHRGL
jgi:serine/threonine-protein kinase RIO1